MKSKPNMKQTFVISQVSREQIKAALEEHTGEPPVTIDPALLTDEFCQRYADAVGQLYDQAPDMSEDAFDEGDCLLHEAFLTELNAE